MYDKNAIDKQAENEGRAIGKTLSVGNAGVKEGPKTRLKRFSYGLQSDGDLAWQNAVNKVLNGG